MLEPPSCKIETKTIRKIDEAKTLRRLRPKQSLRPLKRLGDRHGQSNEWWIPFRRNLDCGIVGIRVPIAEKLRCGGLFLEAICNFILNANAMLFGKACKKNAVEWLNFLKFTSQLFWGLRLRYHDTCATLEGFYVATIAVVITPVEQL